MNRYIFLILLFVLLSPLIANAQCENPHAEMGVLIMNKKHKVMQYCNGDDWIGLWGGRGGGAGLPTCADGEIAQFSGGEWRCNNGSGIDNLNASNLTSGTVPPARLGTGTANNTTYLRGDGQWAAPSSGGVTQTTSADCTATTAIGVRSCSVTCPAGYIRSACYGGGWYASEYDVYVHFEMRLPTLSGNNSCTCSAGYAGYYSAVTACRIYCIK